MEQILVCSLHQSWLVTASIVHPIDNNSLPYLRRAQTTRAFKQRIRIFEFPIDLQV